jgi:hypothetical protein
MFQFLKSQKLHFRLSKISYDGNLRRLLGKVSFRKLELKFQLSTDYLH